MDVRSIKQFAEEQNVSYEAVRKQIVKYSEELKDHIVRKNRTQYLDEWAVEFLKEKRRESPIVLMNMDQNEEIENLKAQVDLLKTKLLSAQDQIISLQSESTKAIEAQVKYTVLLEDNKAKEEKLKEAEDQIRTIRTEADDLRKKSEEDLKKIEDLQTEIQSFQKSIFGFYRKR